MVLADLWAAPILNLPTLALVAANVSIIIPLYNKEQFVQRTLDSILSQTYQDFEVIVVNDGSTDDGPSVVARCDDPRIRLIHQQNAGPGAARNRGVAEAKGPLTAFLDADDEWMPRFLDQSLACLGRNGSEAACVGSGYVKYPAGESMERMWRGRGLRDGIYRLSPEVSPLFAVHLLAYFSPWNTVARTQTIKKWGGFFDRSRCLYAEDSYLWLKVLLNETVVVQMKPLVRFHSEASNLSGNLAGARPVEPKLLHPEELEAVCPDELRPLLENVLVIRAIKTACMLSYWGRWREARALLDRFCPSSKWRLPGFGLAHAAATPPGAVAGKIARVAAGLGRLRTSKTAQVSI